MVKKRFEKYGTTYHLILMDFKMPVMNGCEATMKIREYLREANPVLKHPIIACTTSYTGKVFKK